MEDVAVKELGVRIGKLETGQALVLDRLDAMTVQFGKCLAEMKAHNGKIDDHEVRIDRRETAYHERVIPALDRLRNLELKVAGSAMVGGGLVYLVTEIMKGLT